MEAADLKLIETNKDHYELNKLFQRHTELGGMIDSLEKSKGLGPNEEGQLHSLKKEKLLGREKLETILSDLRG